MLRVGLLLDHPSPHMVGLLDALANREDVAARVVYFRTGAPERRWGDPAGELPYAFAGAGGQGVALFNTLPVTRAMSDVRADVWVVNSCYTALETWAGVFWLNARGIPWVYMNEPLRPRGRATAVKESLLRTLLRRASGVVGMGREAERRLANLAGGGRPSTSVPYYVDLGDFLSLSPSPGPGKGDPVRFFTAAQLIHRKGIDVLLDACGRLSMPGWTLTIAGAGPLRSRYEGVAANRWPGGQVRFLGEVPYVERAAAYSGMHVFVFPSRWDGWGVAPVEAMAAALPVIATDQVMSMRDLLRDGENGFLVSAEDPVALAARMSTFMSHPRTVASMGQAARGTVSAEGVEHGVERLVNLLERVVEGESAPTTSAPSACRGTESRPVWKELTESRGITSRARRRIRAAAKAAYIDGASVVRSRANPRGNRILVYHLVLSEDRPRLDEHVQFLRDHYRLVTVQEMVERMGSLGDPLAAISFDDGFQELMADALEVLESHGVKATFFVPTRFVELASDPTLAETYSRRSHYYERPLRPMCVGDLQRLQELGHEVASHGVHHIGLDSVSASLAERELQQSHTRLTEWMKAPPGGFAYPYGASRSSVGEPARWVRSAGYRYAVTLKRGRVDSNTNRYLLPREHVEGNWRLRDLKYFLGK